ncbi:alpha/beta hydrolase [Rhodococcus aetherivorans]
MAWFRTWLDEVAPAPRPVILVGFSGGAAFAGGLLLHEPRRFAGAAILYGTLPFDAGVPITAARLAGVPVFLAQGETDTVIPRDLLDRTWTYLLGESGAPTYARKDPGGHGLPRATVAQLAGWISERLDFLTRRPRRPRAARPGPLSPAPRCPTGSGTGRRCRGRSRSSSGPTTAHPTCRNNCSPASRPYPP